jgi:hypothetical protein
MAARPAQVVAIAGVSFSIWWFMMASEGAKATLEEFAAPVLGAGASAAGWLMDSALALKERIQGAAAHARLGMHACMHACRVPLSCVTASVGVCLGGVHGCSVWVCLMGACSARVCLLSACSGRVCLVECMQRLGVSGGMYAASGSVWVSAC